MPPGAAPKVSPNAGATTTANSRGASTGISSSRGVRTLSARRRRARVNSAARPSVRDRGRVTAGASNLTVSVTAVIGISLVIGCRISRGERRARELEVDVVEGRLTGGDGDDGQPQFGDLRDHLVPRSVAQR